tara:strand:- start:2294 stop:4297 length:2004 start_codon:yes stop_codon:yes gene_type:complete
MGIISTQAFTFRLVANGTQLDIFDDEDILLSNNVTGLFDIGVLPADFTRQITIPGTKVNNAFFEHVYDISIDSPFLFATNIKVPCYIDFDSIYLIEGYLQLNKVNVRANKFIESYDITLYGSLSSFARDINRNFLTDLTSLSQYNHTASYDNITASWSGSLFNGDIVYPLADYGSGYKFTSGQYEIFGMDDQDGGLTVQNFKPAIRVKPVLDAIFEEAGYTYTSSFMAQPMIDDIYLFCNNSLKYPEFSSIDLETYGKIKVAAISGSGMTDKVLTSGSWTTLPWYNELSDPQNFYTNGAYRVEKQTNLTGILNINVNVSCSVNNMPGTLSANGTWQLRMLETGSATPYSTRAIQSYIFFFDQLQQSRNGGINQNYELATEFKLDDVPPGNYYFQIRQSPNSATPPLPLVTLDPQSTTKSYLEIKQVNQAADGRIMDIPSNMPYGTVGIKQIDFILGLQKKFNLVIYPDRTKSNQFIIETFNNWYKRGEVKDFNKYINLDESIEVINANNLAVNKLNFADTLDTDYISQQFSKAANREYGKTYYVDTNNFYSQGTFEVKTTFASDPLIRIAGTGLSGSVGGINPTITQYSAGTYDFTNINSSLAACSSSDAIEIFTANGDITTGQTAYIDQYGSIPLTGYYYFSNGLQVYRISVSTGEILGFVRLCSR